MNVIIVVDRYVPEARSAAHLFHDLATGLSRRGHGVRVVAKYPTENLPAEHQRPPRRERHDGVDVVRMPSPFGEPRAIWAKAVDQALFAIRVCAHILFGRRADAVLVYSPPLPLAGACALAGWLSGTPVALNLHDLYPGTAIDLGRMRNPIIIGAARWLERFVYRHSQGILVPSPESVDYVRAQNRRPDLHVKLVYNWIHLEPRYHEDDHLFRDAHALHDQFVVTYAGLVGLAQDLSAVVEAARLALDDPSLVFLVIGEGATLGRWKQAGKGLANLRFLPVLPRAQYLQALRASDAGLIALAADLASPAVPFKLQSIMAVGRPVLAVVPKGSAAARVVRESKCGLITPPGDGRALLDAVTQLRRDPALRTGLADAGYEFARLHFAPESAVGDFEDSLRRIGRMSA